MRARIRKIGHRLHKPQVNAFARAAAHDQAELPPRRATARRERDVLPFRRVVVDIAGLLAAQGTRDVRAGRLPARLRLAAARFRVRHNDVIVGQHRVVDKRHALAVRFRNRRVKVAVVVAVGEDPQAVEREIVAHRQVRDDFPAFNQHVVGERIKFLDGIQRIHALGIVRIAADIADDQVDLLEPHQFAAVRPAAVRGARAQGVRRIRRVHVDPHHLNPPLQRVEFAQIKPFARHKIERICERASRHVPPRPHVLLDGCVHPVRPVPRVPVVRTPEIVKQAARRILHPELGKIRRFGVKRERIKIRVIRVQQFTVLIDRNLPEPVHHHVVVNVIAELLHGDPRGARPRRKNVRRARIVGGVPFALDLGIDVDESATQRGPAPLAPDLVLETQPVPADIAHARARARGRIGRPLAHVVRHARGRIHHRAVRQKPQYQRFVIFEHAVRAARPGGLLPEDPELDKVGLIQRRTVVRVFVR